MDGWTDGQDNVTVTPLLILKIKFKFKVDEFALCVWIIFPRGKILHKTAYSIYTMH